MTSHEYARKLKVTAEFLLSRPEFNLPSYKDSANSYLGSYYQEKDAFLSAVKALGAVNKSFTGTELKISCSVIGGGDIYFDIARSVVCRKVQEEKWECQSLLTPEEEATILTKETA